MKWPTRQCRWLSDLGNPERRRQAAEDDASHMLKAYGPHIYPEARSRARQARTDRIGVRVRHWSQVARMIESGRMRDRRANCGSLARTNPAARSKCAKLGREGPGVVGHCDERPDPRRRLECFSAICWHAAAGVPLAATIRQASSKVISQALVMPCRAPRARLYSGRLVQPGPPPPWPKAAMGDAIVVARANRAAPVLTDNVYFLEATHGNRCRDRTFLAVFDACASDFGTDWRWGIEPALTSSRYPYLRAALRIRLDPLVRSSTSSVDP
ncbi:hypothetical protein EKPJFOCH_1315 [Methylobacterium thuringiense]|uniref:Uncharacterized protein n=1 Tax=Methylobacterium thuringiense TaxID=1003091 RepID=A0ABQ4TMA5_9HYPH|nr:hypothetical protein EKPJFOCH_1315 [Methylobacterium thuringiense]